MVTTPTSEDAASQMSNLSGWLTRKLAQEISEQEEGVQAQTDVRKELES